MNKNKAIAIGLVGLAGYGVADLGANGAKKIMEGGQKNQAQKLGKEDLAKAKLEEANHKNFAEDLKQAVLAAEEQRFKNEKLLRHEEVELKAAAEEVNRKNAAELAALDKETKAGRLYGKLNFLAHEEETKNRPDVKAHAFFGPQEHHVAANEKIDEETTRQLVEETLATYSSWGESKIFADKIVKALARLAKIKPQYFKLRGQAKTDFLKSAFAVAAHNQVLINDLDWGETHNIRDAKGKKRQVVKKDYPALEKAAALQDAIYSLAYPTDATPPPPQTLAPPKHHRSKHK